MVIVNMDLVLKMHTLGIFSQFPHGLFARIVAPGTTLKLSETKYPK